MDSLEAVSVGLDLVLAGAAVASYRARPRHNSHLARWVRVLLIGILVLGCAHLLETWLFVWTDVSRHVNEVVFQLLLMAGLGLVIFSSGGLRKAIEEAALRGAGAGHPAGPVSPPAPRPTGEQPPDRGWPSREAELPGAGPAAVSLLELAAVDLAAAADLAAAEPDTREPAAAPITILLVDDHPLFRDGLVRLINSQPDMCVVGEAGLQREAIALARTLKPQLVLLDITLGDGTGLEAASVIRADQPDIKIVCLTMHMDDEHLFAALRAGVLGYVVKSARVAELLQHVRAVARGEASLSPEVAHRVMMGFSRTLNVTGPETSLGAVELTPRETEIIQLLARGATNREIARELVVSESTVKNHVHSVLTKLRLRRRWEVIAYARRHNLPPPAP